MDQELREGALGCTVPSVIIAPPPWEHKSTDPYVSPHLAKADSSPLMRGLSQLEADGNSAVRALITHLCEENQVGTGHNDLQRGARVPTEEIQP